MKKLIALLLMFVPLVVVPLTAAPPAQADGMDDCSVVIVTPCGTEEADQERAVNPDPPPWGTGQPILPTDDAYWGPPSEDNVEGRMAGCKFSSVRIQAQPWYRDVFYQAPGRGWFPVYHDIRVVGTAVYWYCPNGPNHDDKIRVAHTTFCFTHIDDPSIVFDGVKFNPNFWDDEPTDTNPPQTKVDKGGIQECRTQFIPYEDQRWMKLGYSPAWSVSTWIVKQGMPDDHWDLKYPYNDVSPVTYRYFRPSHDMILSGWMY